MCLAYVRAAAVVAGVAVGRVRIVLFERDRELDLMADLPAGVGSPRGKVVLVRGEAGIGKAR